MVDSPTIKTACSSPKRYTGRMNYDVQFIVLHHTTTNSFNSTRDWFCNHNRGGSAHYCIDRHGEIYQFVSLSDTAWHCGDRKRPWRLNNQRSVGIELTQQDPSPFTTSQYSSLAYLVLWLCQKFKIPPVIIDEPHITKPPLELLEFRGVCGHSSVVITDCPGPFFDWGRLAKEMESFQAEGKFKVARDNYNQILFKLIKNIKGVVKRWIG
jgi:hypothetical protein